MKKRMVALLLMLVMVLPLMMASAIADEIPARTLEYGMEGADVLAAQVRLAYYEYYTGAQDGKFGPGMQSSVREFQTRNGLKVDGKIGPATLAMLNGDSALKKSAPDPASSLKSLKFGSYGDEVKKLQENLFATYYYKGAIDGIFGYDVSVALKAFQTSAGLTVDGVAGTKTFDALYNRKAKIFNGGIPVRNLSSGDRGYDVLILQARLNQLNCLPSGYYSSGYFDSSTVDAVKTYQKQNNLTQTGKADATLRRYLWPSSSQGTDSGSTDGTQRTMKLGSVGTDVAQMQMRLKSGGYLLGNADGIFGVLTQQAVIKFQKDHNIKQDGLVGAITLELINMLSLDNVEPSTSGGTTPGTTGYSRTLRAGCSGSDVRKLQTELAQAGFYTDTIDGKYGPQTTAAVKAFQKYCQLTVDGVAGSKTFIALQKWLGTQYELNSGDVG